MTTKSKIYLIILFAIGLVSVPFVYRGITGRNILTMFREETVAPTVKPNEPKLTVEIQKGAKEDVLVMRWDNIPNSTARIKIYRAKAGTTQWVLWKTIDLKDIVSGKGGGIGGGAGGGGGGGIPGTSGGGTGGGTEGGIAINGGMFFGDIESGSFSVSLGAPSDENEEYVYYVQAVIPSVNGTGTGTGTGTGGGPSEETILWTSPITETVISSSTPGTTPPPSPTSDTTAPTTSLTAPANGSTVSGTVNIAANATDNTGVIRVEFYVDGALRSSDTSSPYSYSWNTTEVANSSHSLQSKAYDAAGNIGVSATVTVTVNNPTADTTAPIISGVSATNITTTGATINWTTNELADSLVEYGTTTSYGQTASGVSLAKSHSMIVSNLTASTFYHYRVKSKDAAGNPTTSGDSSFVTSAATPSGIPYYNPQGGISGYGQPQSGNFWVQHTDNKIDIGWQNPPAGTTKFIVSRSQNQNGPWSAVLTQQNPPSGGPYSIKILDHTLYEPYYYKMDVYGAQNNITATYGPEHLPALGQ